MWIEPDTVGGGVSMEKTSARSARAVEAVDAVGLPALGPARLDAVQRRLLRDRAHRSRIRHTGGSAPRGPPEERTHGGLRDPRMHRPGPDGDPSGHPRARRDPHVPLASMLRLYDTATREVRELAQREPGTVSIYLCGPTVYGPPHLGHGRATLEYDVLARYLRWSRPRGPPRVQHHRHRRQDHRAGRARGPRPGRDRRALRVGVVVDAMAAHRRRRARRHPPRHRVGRRDGRR